MTKREFLDIVFALAPNEANAIMDAFDEYVDSNEPHWIPVTKDLPKESGHYIVTTRTVCLPINLLHPELNRYSNNVRIDYFRAYDNKFDLPSTVAWWSEPLPEPYEGVTE